MRTGFTIAIPSHDRRDTVVLAVRSALEQTRSPEQVIVLCDGCTDGSVEALHALGDERLEVLDLPKLPGYAYAHRNRAIEAARGEAIMWLADDDLLLPDHLERLGEHWDDGAVDVVTTPAVIVHPDDSLEWFGEDLSVAWFREAMADANTNVMASVSVRVALAKEVGGWDELALHAADWDLWRRCLKHGARASATTEPTVLHFRATGRDQEWPDRVRQNTRWFERIADPCSLSDVRRVLRRTRAVRDAGRLADRRYVAAALAQAIASGDEALALAASQADARECVEVERDRLLVERDRLLVERHRLLAVHEVLTAERDAARTMLERIYAGGWWRLRARLLPLLELLGRGDRAGPPSARRSAAHHP